MQQRIVSTPGRRTLSKEEADSHNDDSKGVELVGSERESETDDNRVEAVGPEVESLSEPG